MNNIYRSPWKIVKEVEKEYDRKTGELKTITKYWVRDSRNYGIHLTSDEFSDIGIDIEIKKAFLISKAPDMLESLENLIEIIKRMELGVDNISDKSKIEQAISLVKEINSDREIKENRK